MRQRDLAIRLALGASRAQVARLLLADSFLLSMLGAVGVLLVTAWLTPPLAQVRIPNTPALPPFNLHIDVRLALYMLAVAFRCSPSATLRRRPARPELGLEPSFAG
jgi:ABC-type lipoprotein release transport system permease subunit